MNRVFALLLMLCASSAQCGWYEVTNYIGTIGAAPVHLSLQTFGYINRGEPAQWRVDGSYYYDSHRIPIPLSGHLEPDGRFVLCEAKAPRSSADSLSVPAPSATRPVPCPISLKVDEQGATGEWKDDKRTLAIALRQAGRLDDTGQVRLTGVVEIPMWYHTKTHLLIGLYESSADCPLSMLRLKAVNIASGRTDSNVALACNAGMIMTSIYANVSAGPNPRQVLVEFLGGKAGYDETVTIAPR